jgi:hypothetical protein
MIYCGIASIYGRQEALRRIVGAILPQVDKLIIGLNNYGFIPKWLINPKIDVTLLDNSLGDAAKFLYVENCDGYYVTLDDDLLPPRDYVKRLVTGVDKYNGLVSFHGRKYPIPVEDFKEWTGAYRCICNVNFDVDVNVIGSGCCAFNTQTMKLKLSDFEKPNMADLYLSRVAYEQEVPMVVLQHRKGDILYLKPQTPTIWRSTLDYTEHTEILKSYLK